MTGTAYPDQKPAQKQWFSYGLAVAQALATNQENAPYDPAIMRYTTPPGNFHTVRLRNIFGLVRIVPSDTTEVVINFLGDTGLAHGTSFDPRKGTLTVTGKLPYLPDAPAPYIGLHRVDVVRTMSDGRRSVIADGDFDTDIEDIVSVSIGGAPIDPSRYTQMQVIVPYGTNIDIADSYGAFGIGDGLTGNLIVHSGGASSVYARECNSFRGTAESGCKIKVESVRNTATIAATGESQFTFGSVAGGIVANVSNQATVNINGGQSVTASVFLAYSGAFHHHGTITGDAGLRVYDSSVANVAQVLGTTTYDVAKRAKALINGTFYVDTEGTVSG